MILEEDAWIIVAQSEDQDRYCFVLHTSMRVASVCGFKSTLKEASIDTTWRGAVPNGVYKLWIELSGKAPYRILAIKQLMTYTQRSVTADSTGASGPGAFAPIQAPSTGVGPGVPVADDYEAIARAMKDNGLG